MKPGGAGAVAATAGRAGNVLRNMPQLSEIVTNLEGPCLAMGD